MVAPGDSVEVEPVLALGEETGKTRFLDDENQRVQISAACALSHLIGTAS